jgi:DNA-binding IclR family transcriptional regulator
VAERSFDDDVSSIAAPIFGGQGEVWGCMSLACVAARVTPQLIGEYSQRVMDAAQGATQALGATVPANYRSVPLAARRGVA